MEEILKCEVITKLLEQDLFEWCQLPRGALHELCHKLAEGDYKLFI